MASCDLIVKLLKFIAFIFSLNIFTFARRIAIVVPIVKTDKKAETTVVKQDKLSF
ncbi:hypothetical protein Y10_15810 [Neptunitalea sp. Y10]|uniref:Uncharacterized protein n=1 Tax=Neptunitalea lumnitzerae TaxID=2965509 RepID=A0ABQ5MIJ3_9FLAO|nr:hypothetical protein Y10_15810 [Neptunitalea sp. Y10]